MRILSGTGAFSDKEYAYETAARAVKEIAAVLRCDNIFDYIVIENSPPEKAKDSRKLLIDTFVKEYPTFNELDIEEIPGSEKFHECCARDKLCYLQKWFGDLTQRKYDALLAWDIDCTVSGPDFALRWPIWKKHLEAGHVVFAPIKDLSKSNRPVPTAYLFHPSQLKGNNDEPVNLANFTITETRTKKGIKTRNKRFKLAKKFETDDLVLCVTRHQCPTWMNRACEGSNLHCEKYSAPQDKTTVSQAVVWAVANPHMGKDAEGKENFMLTQLNAMPLKLDKAKPDDEGMLRCHGGAMGFALIPASVLRRFKPRYKRWVNDSPETWFFFDLARAGISVYLDTKLTVVHNGRKWSEAMKW